MQSSEPSKPLEFVPPSVDQNASAASNVEWNRQRWGQRPGWESHDSFGYQWSGSNGYKHSVAGIAKFFDSHLRPFTKGRYDLDILEISPGAGRSTAELLRYANTLTVVDLNEAAISICRERFKHAPETIEYWVNDGESLDFLTGRTFDLIFSFDSLVHVDPSIVRGYLLQSASLLSEDGLIWLDTSGKGQRSKGRRTAVTASLISEWGQGCGLTLVDQRFRNDWDCISIFTRTVLE